MRPFKKWFLIIASILLITIMSACGSDDGSDGGSNQSATGDSNTITIRVQSLSPETTRVENIALAAEKLNEELKAEGEDIQIQVETDMYDGSSDDYAKQFMLAHQAKKEPDIYTTGHENIGWLADGNYILPLNELKDSEAYKDTFPLIWDAVTYKGEIWGAPQDMESRPVYYNKNLLRELGWTDEEIESLPEKVVNGEFTLDDMTRVAEEAVNKGIVENGIIHRPVEGTDFHAHIFNFGGTVYDSEQNKIVFDKPAVEKTLQYFDEITEKGLTPKDITQMEWSNIHRTVVNGKTLFYYGGLWNVFNWADDPYHDELGKVDEEWVHENFGMMLIPASEKGGKPNTLSHPFVYTVSSNTEHFDYIVRLLEIVADPEIQANHDVKTAHLPVTQSAAEHPDIKNNMTLGKATYMLDYTTFVPNHKDFSAFSKAIFSAIQAVELDQKTVEEAMNDLETQLQNDLGDELIIKE